MWNSEGTDKLFWSEAAKMLLVGLIKKYPDSIRDIKGNRKDLDKAKRDAWDIIYNDLLNYGMPSTNLNRVRYIWVKMKTQAVDAQKKWKRNQGINPMTKVQTAVIDLVDFVNRESQHLMPLPLNIKTEPMDENDTDEVQSLLTTRNLRARKSTSAKPNNKTQDDNADVKNRTENVTAGIKTNNNISSFKLANTDPVIEGNLNPVVVLNRIPIKHQFDGQMVNEESAKYWNLMTKHEQERMEFERELHRKNLELMELKLRIEKEKLETMVPGLFE